MAFDAQNEVSDEALLVLYGNGDPSAAQSLTLRLTPKAFGHAMRVLGDAAEAEDVAQEAMLKLWKIAPDWRQGEAKVTTWLYRVVANMCTDRLRKRRSVGLDEAGEVPDDAISAEGRMQQNERAVALEDALQQLPDRQRQAVVLRHIEGLGNPQIADILDVSVEAVESLTSRGKRALAGILAGRRAELGFEDDNG